MNGVDLKKVGISLSKAGVSISGLHLSDAGSSGGSTPEPDVNNALMLADGSPILLTDGNLLLLVEYPVYRIKI